MLDRWSADLLHDSARLDAQQFERTQAREYPEATARAGGGMTRRDRP